MNPIVLEHIITQILKKVTQEGELTNMEKIELVTSCLSVAAALGNNPQLTVPPDFLGQLSDKETHAIISFMVLGVIAQIAQMANN